LIKFKDYVSGFAEVRALRSKIKPQSNVDFDNFESVYDFEINRLDPKKDAISITRLQSELFWYRAKRPYFNVYPLIEKKLLEIDKNVYCRELSLPFDSIEVRTSSMTFLLSITSRFLFFVVELGNGYQEFLVPKDATLKELIEAPFETVDGETWFRQDASFGITHEDRCKCIVLGAGVCMLSLDKNIVVPVILNCHRRENMTAAEIAEYAAKAAKRTGKTGFDVGKDIERMKSTVHYRNGCFAKYYVSKGHEQFPLDSELKKVPIIKWRCGSVVNKKNAPVVPTGFKDVVCQQS
jgi:hypothetical protein